MKAFMSFLNLYTSDANFQQEGKLATLWFDELLLGVSKDSVKNVIENVSEKESWTNDTLKEVKKIQISSEKILPKVSFLGKSIVKDSKYDTAKQIMQNKYKKELADSKTYGGAMHEVIMGSAGIASTVKYWMLLNAIDNCIFIPISLEQQMIKKLFYNPVDMRYSCFRNIITGMIPDISDLSWDEVIEIRHHGYWTNFRNKLTELNNTYSDGKLSDEILDEIVKKDLVEMAQYLRPQVRKNIIRGIVSNIPLPIPINPASIVCTGYDIFKEIDFKKKYGWIYFYLDNKK